MNRSVTTGLLVLLLAGVARADGGSMPEVRVSPGAGLGLLALSLEMNVEGPRWYAGAQLALAGVMKAAGIAAYGGLRAGAFLTEGPAAPFFGLGLGALGESDFGKASSRGWGASAELGLALRRDQRWFHPQIVLQGIVPFSQRPAGAYPHQSALVVLLGVRIFL
jgi:hypothetical protein